MINTKYLPVWVRVKQWLVDSTIGGGILLGWYPIQSFVAESVWIAEVKCLEWKYLMFCRRKSLVLKYFSYFALFHFCMELLLCLLFLVSCWNVWWYFGLILFHSTTLLLLLLHTIPLLGRLFLPLLVSCTFMFLCFLFLPPETVFDCIFIEVVPWPLTLFSLPLSLIGAISCFPSLSDSLYDYFTRTFHLYSMHMSSCPKTQNPFLTNFAIPASSASFILHLALHLNIVEGGVPPLPCKKGQFQILSWC